MKNALSRAVSFFCVMLSSCFFTSFVPAKLVSRFQLMWGNKSLSENKWTGAGIIGSIWGVVTYLFLPWEMAESPIPILLGICTAILFSHIAEKSLATHDDARIVVDEWIGAWMACWTLPQRFGIEILLAFVFFRVFDVLKGPWGRALQRFPGGFGIVLDDVLAGLLANFLTRGLLTLA